MDKPAFHQLAFLIDRCRASCVLPAPPGVSVPPHSSTLPAGLRHAGTVLAADGAGPPRRDDALNLLRGESLRGEVDVQLDANFIFRQVLRRFLGFPAEPDDCRATGSGKQW